jgi:hypothetical protein
MAAFNDTVTTIITIDGKQAVNQIGALEMEVKDLNTALKSIKKGTQEYIDTNNKLTEVKKNLQDVRDTVGLTGMTIKQLREEKKRLNFEMNNITRGTAAYDEYKAKIQAVTKAINDQQADVKGTKEAWQQAGGGANDMFSKVSGLLKGGVILGVATQVFQIGKEFLALTNEVNKSRESVAKFSELTGEALNNTTAKTRSVAETFGKDFNEVLTAANSLSKSMGISFDESLGLIEKGFIKGADVNGDFLDKVKEYPIQFKQAGFTAEEFIKIAIQEPKSGIFSDKLLDTIKEVGLSLREMTKAQRDALTNAFGSEFTTKLANDINKGKITTADALKVIQEEANKTGLSVSQMQTLTADLFKGAGEDAGGFEKIMQELNNSLSSNINELSDQEKQVAANAKASEEYNKALLSLSQNFAGVGTAFSTFFTNILTSIINATNAVVEFFSLADSRSKKLVANLSYNTTEEAKKSILTIQAQLNAEREKAKSFQTRIDSGFGNTQTRINLKNTQDSIKVLEKAIQEGENKLNDIKQKAADKNTQITKDQTQDDLAQQDSANKTRLEKLKDRFANEFKTMMDNFSMYEKVEKPLEIDLKVKINDFNPEDLKKKIDENFAKAQAKQNRDKSAGAELEVGKAIGAAGIFGENDKSVVSAKLAQLEALKGIELQNKDLTEKEKLNIEAKYLKQGADLEKDARLKRNLQMVEIAQSVTNVLSEISSARFQVETQEAENDKTSKLRILEEQKQAELEKYAGNKDKQQEINAKYEKDKNGIESESEKKIAEIKTRQAKAEKAFNVANAILNGTQAVLKALASAPPPLNFVLAGTVGAVAAVQVAKIIATPIPDYYSASTAGSGGGDSPTGGYYDGGPTQRSPSDRTAVGIVHANEYVIPANLLRKPEIANMAGVIESMRTGGRGFMEGGFTSPTTQSPNTGLEAKLDRLITAIYEMANRPIKTYVVARDVQDELDDWNRIQDESRFG